MSKEAEEVCLLPLGLSHFAGGGWFVGVGVEDVEGEASDDGEVFRGVVLARSGVVFVEDDVEGPVQVVLDRPMRPDGVEELARAEAAREQEVAGRLGGGAVAGPARLDAADRDEAREGVRRLERRRRQHAGAAALLSAVPAFGGLVEGGVLAGLLAGLGEGGLDGAMERPAVALEAEAVMRLPGAHGAGHLGMAV